MSGFHRNGLDLGIQGTIAWLEKWYGEPFDLDIQEVNVPFPSSLDEDHYGEAKIGKQTDLHVFLKYAARCWLEELGIGTVSYERRLYTPDDDVADDVWQTARLPDGRTIQINMNEPRIMERGEVSLIGPYGSLLEVDVLCEGLSNISVEVGGTRPFNLLTPLLDGLVAKAVWIPFPADRTITPKIIKGYAVTGPS